MTRIRFYTDVAEPAALMQQLIGQALARQRRVTIFTRDQQHAQQLSEQLWQQAPEAFMPNALADASHALHTPVVLAWQAEHIKQEDLLFNCQPEQPMFFGRFRHLFEIIGQEIAEKAAGRQRYAFYRDRGYEIQHMNMQKVS